MANGGILVSGGISGNGTLISTNLLYAPLLRDAYGNAIARPSVTLGGTAGAAGYEAAFAIDKDPRTLWKTASLDTDITYTMDLGVTTLTVYGVVVVGHNIPTTGLTHALLEGGTTNACGDVSQALVLNADTYTPGYHLLATPVAKRYWRLNVQFAAATALQIGEVFLLGSAPLAFARNYNWRGMDDVEIGKIYSDGIHGVPRQTALWERKRADLPFTNISSVQLTALQLAARNGHVVFSPESSDGFAFYGVLTLEPPVSLPGSQWDVMGHFTECAK
jgi:hypothetical protein